MAGPARDRLAGRGGRAEYGWVGAAIFGDSGSPARVTTLAAAGNLTHIGAEFNGNAPYVSDVFGTRIGVMEGNGWTLLSSRLCL